MADAISDQTGMHQARGSLPWCCGHSCTSQSGDACSTPDNDGLRSILFSVLVLLSPSVRAVVEIDDVLLESNDTLPANPKPLLSMETSSRRLRCVGWRATGNCTPDGPREPQNDKSCADHISGGAAGYCEVEDVESGKHFQAMRAFWSGLQHETLFRC
ncbi:hypothetical protein PHYPSEUDO_005799 [Phytophthora pseudosyringae]|uniref:Uncharacterized protein n=1 Tax=Phytophthora pseudosyringae TaxID=221518 RepID=A0A8T1VKK6_9STRA|nr:hypothetical protein PHYPSEUDO_005799 [Phytophthora pseudosyringae]